MRSGIAKVCPKCGEIRSQKDFIFKSGSSVRHGRICLECKSISASLEYISTSKGRIIKLDNELSKSETKKLLNFTANPERYATGTSRAKEKVEYLESIKHKFSEGQLGIYTTARKKYDIAIVIKKELRIQRTDYYTILADAFNSHRSVRICYKGLWRTIDPYSLNRIYIVAYCHFASDIRTFRIDRIQGAKLLGIFSFDKSLKTTAQSRIDEAPSYKGYGKYRSRY